MNAQSGRDALAKLAAQLRARGGAGGGGIPGGRGPVGLYGLGALVIAGGLLIDSALFNGMPATSV